MTARKFRIVPKDAVVKPKDERPVKAEVKPEEVYSKQEIEDEQFKSADHDMDGRRR